MGKQGMMISRRQAIGGAAMAGAALTGLVAQTGQAEASRARASTKQWWMDEPVRLALVLPNEKSPLLETDQYVQWAADMNANAVLIPTGGITAYYPTRVPFHYECPLIPAGRDPVGEIVTKARARGIRVMSRFEWTASQVKGIAEARPDWVQRDEEGQPRLWTGMTLMCVNGGYQQEQIFKIMGEVLDRYPIEGVFFNAGGGQRIVGGQLCYCDNCKRAYRAKYNKDIPAKLDAEYSAFMIETTEKLLARCNAFLHARRPGINFMMDHNTDSSNAETHGATLIGTSPYWVFGASEQVNRYRADYPDKMIFNNDAAFIDGLWRFAHRSPADGEIRAYQNMANGAGPYIFVNGPVDQYDANGFRGARPAFKFHKDHEELYVRQQNAARVLLLDVGGTAGISLAAIYGGPPASRPAGPPAGPPAGRPAGPPPVGPQAAGSGGFGYADGQAIGASPVNSSMRGFFRLLTENHVPFVLSGDLSWVDTDPNRYDLVVSGRGAPAALDKYLRAGGRLLVAGAERPQLDLPPTVKIWPRLETRSSYWRVRDPALFPSLKGSDLLFVYSDYLELESQGNPALTFVPTSMTNPMEKIGVDMMDTDKPGIHVADYGKGRLVYLPWDVGDLYYRASGVNHSAMVNDLLEHLLADNRQIVTNAHPTVQITIQQQVQQGRTNVHFVNLSGQSQTAYFAAIPMTGIQVQVLGNFASARMASATRELPVRRVGGYTSFTLPTLDTYDVVTLT